MNVQDFYTAEVWDLLFQWRKAKKEKREAWKIYEPHATRINELYTEQERHYWAQHQDDYKRVRAEREALKELHKNERERYHKKAEALKEIEGKIPPVVLAEEKRKISEWVKAQPWYKPNSENPDEEKEKVLPPAPVVDDPPASNEIEIPF